MFILFLFHRMKLILLFPWLALTIFTLEVRAFPEKENKGIVESATVKETFIHVIQVDFLPCFVHELFIPQFICEVKGYLLLCRVTWGYEVHKYFLNSLSNITTKSQFRAWERFMSLLDTTNLLVQVQSIQIQTLLGAVTACSPSSTGMKYFHLNFPEIFSFSAAGRVTAAPLCTGRSPSVPPRQTPVATRRSEIFSSEFSWNIFTRIFCKYLQKYYCRSALIPPVQAWRGILPPCQFILRTKSGVAVSTAKHEKYSI